jgi:periplasmic protein TonB
MTYADYIAESRRLRGIRWAGAAVLVIALHAGGALALLHLQEDDSPDVPGSIAIELAPIVTAAAITATDVAPGPREQEEAPAPEARKEKEAAAEEMPRVEQAPLAPEPEVQLPDSQPEKKEERQEREEVIPEKNFRQTAAEPATTAPPASQATPSATAAAPSPGLSILAARTQATWHKSLVAHINRYKRYPVEARANHIEGVVTVEFTLDRSGNVISSQVTQSSGSSVLDQEAMAMLTRSAPLPPPPTQVGPDEYRLALPIHFRIK